MVDLKSGRLGKVGTVINVENFEARCKQENRVVRRQKMMMNRRSIKMSVEVVKR